MFNDLIQRLLVVVEARVRGLSETRRQEQALENIFGVSRYGRPVKSLREVVFLCKLRFPDGQPAWLM